jgi:hypothetical protein
MERMDRIAAEAEGLKSLMRRLEAGRTPAATVVSGVAQRLHLLAAAIADLDAASPGDLYVAVDAVAKWFLLLHPELEPAGRGVYGGVVGYIGFGGDSDLAIAIRTAVLVGTTATVQAGAGIVADSIPQSEYDETVNKAAAPLRAIAAANALRPALD